MELNKGIRTEFENQIIYNIQNGVNSNLVEHILLNGEWGSGKTYSINKIISRLDEENICIYFDAWEYDYHELPQLAIIQSMINAGLISKEFMDNISSESRFDSQLNFRKIFVELFAAFSNINLDEFLDYSDHIGTFKNSIYQRMTYEEMHNKLLIDLVRNLKSNNVIIFIDELDRAKPNFVISILEYFHHFKTEHLPEKNVKIVYAADKQALIMLVNHYYGFGHKSIDYIEKIFNTEIFLPSLNTYDYLDFINKYDEKHVRKYRFGYFNKEILAGFLDKDDISLRTVEFILEKINDNNISEFRHLTQSNYLFSDQGTLMLLSGFNIDKNSLVLKSFDALYTLVKYMQITNSKFKFSVFEPKLFENIVKEIYELVNQNEGLYKNFLTMITTESRPFVTKYYEDMSGLEIKDKRILSGIFIHLSILFAFLNKFDKERLFLK